MFWSAASALFSLFLMTSTTAAPTLDLFTTPISTAPPLSQFTVRDDHPVARHSIVGQGTPVPTNKFYANLFLGNQNQGVWLHPYMVWWSKGDSGPLKSWGLSVSHADDDQKAYGPDTSANPVQYYINPIGIQSFTFSAAEFSPSRSSISLSNLTHLSAQLTLHAEPRTSSKVATFILVQGTGFVTGTYNGLTPRFESAVGFRRFKTQPSPRPGLAKWKVTLEDGKIWLIYASSLDNLGGTLQLRMSSPSRIDATGAFTGAVQLTKVPAGSVEFESVADASAGAWALTTTLSGAVAGTSATYAFTFEKAGLASAPLLMYALPHHVESFDASTSALVKRDIQLQSTTKGRMTAVLADRWILTESELPVDVGFSPLGPVAALGYNLNATERAFARKVVLDEARQDVSAQSDLDSMYFSGKALDKFALMAWATWDMLRDKDTVEDLLARLKTAFERFAQNRQRWGLVYDGAWKGLVSSAMYAAGDLLSDFGNGCYNDHHFHYGYFVHTAAVIAQLDKELGHGSAWLDQSREFVDNLVRDASNPSTQDPYFPVSRAFDWFHGHSWAKGLFESADGKDQESTSEDAHFSYALKLWGAVTGDAAVEGRGDLMLAIQKRVFDSYFLMRSDNVNQPKNFIENKVSGILFENKCDHATYFGGETRYIQGIHMLPLTPASRYIRSAAFVKEEWDRYFSNGRVDQSDDSWMGIVYEDYALVDPGLTLKWLTRSDFKQQWLDGGASRTWYLALAAGWNGGRLSH